MYLYERIQREKEREEHIKKMQNTSTITISPEDDYGEEGETHFIATMCSSSHTYGNVLAFMQNYIINIFPKDLFKTIHVNSKIAHRQIRSTPKEFLKKTKPMIIFRPRIAGINEDRFLKGTKLIERDLNVFHTWDRGQLQNFFNDPQNKVSIKYLMNRAVMYIDVVCCFSTLMQQLDFYDMLANTIAWDNPSFVKTCLESYLSPELLGALSSLCGIPIVDEKGNTKNFVQYMNQNSIYPITYKLQGSSKTKEFYRYYPVNIETTFNDLDKDDGDRVGNVMDQYKISFSVKMEFNTSGYYYLIGEDVYKINLPVMNQTSDELTPIFTDVLLQEDYNLQHGWHLYNRVSIRLDNENDTLNLTQLINQSTIEAINYHLKNGLPLYDLIDVRVRKQGQPIHENREYEINWDIKELKFINQHTYFTYSILVYINVEYVNDLIKKIFNLK